jgi:hypothetical protein
MEPEEIEAALKLRQGSCRTRFSQTRWDLAQLRIFGRLRDE